ncbi:MAG: hypothetical protein ABSG56_20915 [Bryobacteraceae bacterium]
MNDLVEVIGMEHAAGGRSSTGRRDRRFYLIMALASAAGVFLGFAHSYYLKTYFATPALPLLLHLHGAVFTAWILFFVAQTALIAGGRAEVHRRLGYGGAFLASAMVILGCTVAFWMAKAGHFRSIPFARDPESACFFALVDMLQFAVFIAAGFWFRRNREAHQRIMLMATVCPLLPSGLGRFAIAINPALAPILIYAFVLAGPVYDLISRRRVHRAYILGVLFFFLLSPPVRILIGMTQGWHRFVHWIIG